VQKLSALLVTYQRNKYEKNINYYSRSVVWRENLQLQFYFVVDGKKGHINVNWRESEWKGFNSSTTTKKAAFY
jgi:hypothetical protein